MYNVQNKIFDNVGNEIGKSAILLSQKYVFLFCLLFTNLIKCFHNFWAQIEVSVLFGIYLIKFMELFHHLQEVPYPSAAVWWGRRLDIGAVRYGETYEYEWREASVGDTASWSTADAQTTKRTVQSTRWRLAATARWEYSQSVRAGAVHWEWLVAVLLTQLPAVVFYKQMRATSVHLSYLFIL